MTANLSTKFTSQQQILLLLKEKQRRDEKKRCEDSFSEFVKCAWHVLEPGRELKWNWSVQMVCDFLEAFSRREFHRGIVNIPPRNMKSLLISVCYEAWVWIQDREARFGGAGHQFLCLANSDGLAERDATKQRTLVKSDWYQGHWGDKVILKKDQDAKKIFQTTANGKRTSAGITARQTGKDADTILIDDPHDAKGVEGQADRETVTSTYDTAVTTRMNDMSVGGILIIMQRLHEMDLVGHVIAMEGLWSPKNPKGWVKLCLPMEYELDDPETGEKVNPAEDFSPRFKDPRQTPGELIWEERFPAADVAILKNSFGGEDSIGASGQLQQRPSPADGGIIKKDMWRLWTKKMGDPDIFHQFVSWDTAASAKDKKDNAYSAYTRWGVFKYKGKDHLMLLGHWYDRVPYYELREAAIKAQSRWNPDGHLIEAKSTGTPLYDDLQVAGYDGSRVRLRRVTPDKDKVQRLELAAVIFNAGMVWVNEAHRKRGEVVRACAKAPNGAPPSADIADTVSQAVYYLTKSWYIRHPDDMAGDNYIGSRSTNTDDADKPMTDELRYAIEHDETEYYDDDQVGVYG